MVFEAETKDAFGHKKLGGIGDLVSERLKELSPKYNGGKTIDVINQKLGYLVRCGDPDAIDSIVPCIRREKTGPAPHRAPAQFAHAKPVCPRHARPLGSIEEKR